MSGKSFFDTSILIYVISLGDARAAKAEELLAEGGCISVQVLNEFVAVARRKLKMPWHEVRDALSTIRSLCEAPTPLSVATHEAALEIAEQYGYHIYDDTDFSPQLSMRTATLYTQKICRTVKRSERSPSAIRFRSAEDDIPLPIQRPVSPQRRVPSQAASWPCRECRAGSGSAQ